MRWSSATPGVGVEVEGDGPLIGIQIQERERLVGVRVVAREGGHGAGGVAGAGTLDLGDLCSEVGHELGAVWACHMVGQVEYLYAFKRGGQVVLRDGIGVFQRRL